MAALKRLLAWLGGTAALYALLVLAILAGAFVAPWVKSQWSGPTRQLAVAQKLEDEVVAPLEAERTAAKARLDAVAADARTQGADQLDAAITEASAQRMNAVSQRRGVRDRAMSLAAGRTDELLADGRRELEIQARDVEIAGLKAARERVAKGATLQALRLDLESSRTSADLARLACRSARLDLEAAQARWPVRATLGLYDREKLRDLDARRKTACDASIAADRRQLAAQRASDLAADAYAAARAWTDQQIGPAAAEVEARIARERVGAQGTLRQKFALWAERVHLSDALGKAAIALVFILVSPFLIRLLCWFVLAPAVMRRPQIRIAGSKSAPIAPAERSAASVGLRLTAGEELLVRQGFLQSTSDAGPKSTRWLLDPRHPFTSIAAGLTFLTRIRGEGEQTTISATHDPFAEVTVLTLPAGSSCVLQPRALAAVAQPIGPPLRMTSHWRLLSLNAWLTLHLRFLVFHGPARLVLKGGRGVRIERAEQGRVFGQDQVVGFSTDLGYAVTRTETFWPYFLGREPLLKDRVTAGGGVLILEEAPMAAGGAGRTPRGIEGAIDAVMKVFGL